MAEHIIDFVRRPVMLFTPSIVVLDGVCAANDFVLEDGVVFRATTSLEKRRFYFGEDPQLPAADGLPTNFETGYAPDHILEIAQVHFKEAADIAETFIFACRLLGLDTVGYRYIEQKSDNPVRPATCSRLGPIYGSATAASTAELLRDQAEALRQQWDQFRRLHTDRDWRIAVSRYGQSYTRPSFEDQIVDLCVALESVFAKESREGEINFRVSLRASRLLHTNPDDRYDAFKRIRNAYNDRSVVVHGNAITKDKDWNRIIETIPYLRDILRQVFLKVVREGWRPDYPRMDFFDTI